MREKYLWLLIAALLILVLGQSCYIYERSAAAKEAYDQEPMWPEIEKSARSERAAEAQRLEFEKWRESIRDRLERGRALGEGDFDLFFNDRFFSERFDPFAEIEMVRQRLADAFSGAEKDLFDGYWDRWFTQRMVMGRFKTDTVRSASGVTQVVHVPGLASGTADVSVTADRVRISFRAKTVSEEKTAGGFVRRETLQDYVKIFPIPDDAAPGTGKAEITGETIRINYDLKKRMIDGL